MRSHRRRLTVSWSTGFGIAEELSSLAKVDTLLAIASRRDERRTLPDTASGRARRAAPRCGAAVRLLEERAALDVRRADVPGAGRAAGRCRLRPRQPPDGRARRRRSSSAGRVPVLFDAGRAAQSMLLAAWSEGLASCPNGIRDADRRAPRSTPSEDETPVIVLSFGRPERARDPERHTVAEWSARANRKPIDEVVRRVS